LGTASAPSGAESQDSSSPPNATGEPRTGAPKQAVSEGAEGLVEDMTRSWVGGWKFHRELYAKYGGKVISQVMGPNAVGARRRWLEDEEAKGSFHIAAPALRKAFYKAVSGYGGGTISHKEATEAFNNPPWALLREQSGTPKSHD